MLSLPRTRLLFGLALLAAVFGPVAASRGQGAKKPPNTKNVTIKTFDGVDLSGTFYPEGGKRKDAVVILLHDFNLKTGGDSHKEGWADLAAELQLAGYAVLSFDFRGFGGSTAVNKEKFWQAAINAPLRRGGKQPEEISHKQFNASYMPNLVNDIAAAKAYLDRQNDDKACNTSSTILIGAGEGATLGAMWVANECRRRKDKNPPPAIPGVPRVPGNLGDPESNNLAAGVWLGVSPTLGGVNRRTALGSWLIDAGRDHKIPQAFVYGGQDPKAEAVATGLLKQIKPGKNAKELPFTMVQSVQKTKLTGHLLLESTLDTRKMIVDNYLAGVMETRGNKERVERKVQSSVYWYTEPKSPRALKLNKIEGEEAPYVDTALFLAR